MKKRDATSDVFRAVVFAGAMLGCSSGAKAPSAETLPPVPSDVPVEVADAAPAPAEPDAMAAEPAPPDAAPAPRPRTGSGKPQGRGFLLV